MRPGWTDVQEALGMTGRGKGRVVGCVWVSVADQNEARQVEAIGEVARLFLDKASGENVRDRLQIQEMVKYVREGGTVIVESPDRLARSTADLLELAKDFSARSAALKFLDNPAFNADTPRGEFMLTILGAVAQLERSVIRERQREGIALAKERGVCERRRKLSDEQIVMARRKIADGASKVSVARELAVSRTTLYAALEGTGKCSQTPVHEPDAA